MSRTNYSFGRALEYQLKAELEGFGYWCIRSGSSHGIVDVLAMRSGEILMCQAKRSGYMVPREWNALYELALREHALPLLVEKKEGGKGNRYWRLTGPKVSRKSAPLEVWTPSASGQGDLF